VVGVWWVQFEEGLISRQAISVLIEAAETGLDESDMEAQWRIIAGHFHIPHWLKVMNVKCPKIFKKILATRLSFAVELDNAFLNALERCVFVW